MLLRRHLVLEEPPSRLAYWSLRLALFGLAVAILAIVLVRGTFVEAMPGFIVLASALAIAALAALMALAAFVVIWRNGNPGFGRALTALLLCVVLLAYPAYLVALGYGAPAIADVTTDMEDPPKFEAIARVRRADANSVAYPGGETAARQRAHYPQVTPLQTTAPPDEAYAAALEVLNAHKWLVIDARTPQAGRRDGRIEAVARSAVMGFRDDVVVRVRASGRGARIDIRSASRYGNYDFGSNARRITQLRAEIEEMLDAQAPASQ